MRLEVTRKTDLAARALVALAGSDNRMKGAELADALGTTSGFVPQVLAPLVARGWVRSDPGPTGGYSLATELGSLSVLDVVEAVEGPTDTGRCVLADRPCGEDGPCALHHAWSRARTHLVNELGASRLSSLVEAR